MENLIFIWIVKNRHHNALSFQIWFSCGSDQDGLQFLLSCSHWEFGPQCNSVSSECSTHKPHWLCKSAELHLWEYVFFTNNTITYFTNYGLINVNYLSAVLKHNLFVPQKFQTPPMQSTSHSTSVTSACQRTLSSGMTPTSKWRASSTTLWVYKAMCITPL